QFGLEYVDLSENEPDRDAATLLQKELAFRYQAVPVRFLADDLLLVAVADPTDVGVADDLKLALGHNVRLAVSEPADLERTIPKQMQPAVVTRLKIMGHLDIAERRAPQDGRVSVRFGGQPLDLRMAVIPTTHGEQVVLRILHRAVSKPDLGELGMTPPARESFERAIRQPYGA